MASIHIQPNRQSKRLKEYNYSWPGAYYVTICTLDHHSVFGEIVDGQLNASTWGKTASDAWCRIPNRWAPVELDQWVLMPNHLHGVLLFPDDGIRLSSLGIVVNWYKSQVTKSIRLLDNGRDAVVWQRSYHDHVVRDERDLTRIRDYIAMNPGRWEEDEYYSRNV